MEAQQTNPAPREARQIFSPAVFDALTTAVLVFDARLMLETLNPAAEDLLEVSANQLCGAHIGAIGGRVEAWAPIVARVVASGQSLSEREIVLETVTSGPVTVDCIATPLVAGRDGCQGVLVELVQLDRHRKITREERLVSQSESARAVVRGLAHEIRNPLGGLRGAAQLLERELGDEALKEYTQVIVHEADRLQNLLDRMLGPRTLPCLRRINIHRVTERVRALIGAEVPPGVRVELDYDPSIPELTADPELLIQATLNVARNAAQAVGAEGRIVLRTRIHRQHPIGQRSHRLVARIDVSDDGPGIPEELRDRVFYPMVTGRADGAGLGLSISQSLITQQGGLIECESRPGKTTFSILLPVSDA